MEKAGVAVLDGEGEAELAVPVLELAVGVGGSGGIGLGQDRQRWADVGASTSGRPRVDAAVATENPDDGVWTGRLREVINQQVQCYDRERGPGVGNQPPLTYLESEGIAA